MIIQNCIHYFVVVFWDFFGHLSLSRSIFDNFIDCCLNVTNCQVEHVSRYYMLRHWDVPRGVSHVGLSMNQRRPPRCNYIHCIARTTVFLKLNFRKYPAIHTNYSL